MLAFVLGGACLGLNAPLPKLKQNSWQARLDKALLDVELGPGSRLRLLSKVILDPAVREDVQAAVGVIRERGIGKGHPDAIDKLWPVGTTARADLEALTALRKQIPEALEELKKQSPKDLFASSASSDTTQASVNPSEVLSSLATLATDRTKQRELIEEAKDLVRRTPKSLETPAYKVVGTVEGPIVLGKPEVIEVREYEAFTVASTEMPSGGMGSRAGASGFTTLAAYLFGKNAGSEAMAMTMPVSTTIDAAGNASMAFVLPRRNADNPPAPLPASDVTIAQVPSRLCAVKAFGGLATDQEVERQKQALLTSLDAAGSTLRVVDRDQITVLQYNSPLTVLWRRRNEVAVVVELIGDQNAQAVDAPAEGESWEPFLQQFRADPPAKPAVDPPGEGESWEPFLEQFRL